MNTNLQVFKFENSSIRTVELEGVVWFVAKDAADLLGYAQTSNALKLCKQASTMDELNKINELHPATKWIPEPDVFRLIMKSQMQEAERVQDWVVEEVLPTIRKTGGYSAKVMSPAELILAQAQMLVEHEQRMLKLEQKQEAVVLKVEHQERRLDQIETATDHFTIIGWHRYVNQAGSLPLADAARMGKSATQFCKSNEIEMGSVPDPRFGTAKAYPKWVLDELFSTMQ